jgi:hypothetical protein
LTEQPGGRGAPDLARARCHDGDESSAHRSDRTVARPTCSLPRPTWTPRTSRTAGRIDVDDAEVVVAQKIERLEVVIANAAQQRQRLRVERTV